MRGVAHQAVAAEVAREQPLAEGDAILLRHPVEAGAPPHIFGRLDDEGRRIGVVLIRVRLEPAEFGGFEREGEGVETLVRTEPDESAATQVDVGRERVGVAAANAAVGAIGGDHEVGPEFPRELRFVVDVAVEHELDAEGFAAVLQDVEEALATDAAEAVAPGGDRASLEVDVDVVPVVERAGDGIGRLGVSGMQVVERRVGKHDAPPEGVVRPVALDDPDDVARVGALEQQRRIETGWSTSDTEDAHPIRQISTM